MKQTRKRSVVPETDDLVFIDLSHYVFQRFYAIQRWCKMSGKEFENEDEMLDVFEARFKSSLSDLKKKLWFAWKNVFIVKDCPRETIWRMQIFPGYKSNRNERSGDFNPAVFIRTYQKILPEMVGNLGVRCVSHPHAEADDVIAVGHRLIRTTDATKEKKIIVITNDNDYIQLHDEHTRILNTKLLELHSRYDEEILSVFGLWKAIRGDVSDNIPPIDKKIGDKSALKLAKDPNLLLEKSDEVRAKLELNKKLIMFENIPDDIRDGVEATFRELKMI